MHVYGLSNRALMRIFLTWQLFWQLFPKIGRIFLNNHLATLTCGQKGQSVVEKRVAFTENCLALLQNFVVRFPLKNFLSRSLKVETAQQTHLPPD
jgi:hypothetical protein